MATNKNRFMMQASKKIPFEDPMVLNGVRALYVVSNLIIAGIYLYVQMQINKKRGKELSKRRHMRYMRHFRRRLTCWQT